MKENIKTYLDYLKESPVETIKSLPHLFLIMLLQFVGLVMMAWARIKTPFLIIAGVTLFFGFVIHIISDRLPIILAPSILEFLDID